MTFRQLLYRPAKAGDGHKLFLDPDSSEISVCDWSGSRPELTDDGPLIVGKLQDRVTVEACFSKVIAVVHFEVPVRVTRTSETGRVWLDVATMRALLPFIQPVMQPSDTFRALSADVLFALSQCALGNLATVHATTAHATPVVAKPAETTPG